MSKQVRIDVVLPQPPERVWRALTESRALAKWLMPNDFRPRLGHHFRFTPRRGHPEETRGMIRCEVVELYAPHRLAYTWQESSAETPDLVTWTLEPVEAGTRIRLEHTRLTDLRACASASGLSRHSIVSSQFLIARLARFLAGKRGHRRLARGKVVLSAGSAFSCIAVSPSASILEESCR
jgi:uncharacterized protein YndB with AHSA1/START domain